MAETGLKRIQAPALNAGYGTNVQTTFDNIDANFGVLANTEIQKGDTGKSLLSLNVPWNVLLEIPGETPSHEFEGYIFDDQTSNLTDAFEVITDDSTDTNSAIYQLYNSNSSVLVCFEEPANSLTHVSIKSTMPYVFIDANYRDTDNIISPTNPRTTDMSCSISFDGTNWVCNQNMPTLYYDQDKGTFYWIIDGNKTSIIAQGPKGEDGTSGDILIGKFDSTEYTTPTGQLVTIGEVFNGGDVNQPWVNPANYSPAIKSGTTIILIPDPAISDPNNPNGNKIYFISKTSVATVGDTTTYQALLSSNNIAYAYMNDQTFAASMDHLKEIDLDTPNPNQLLKGYIIKDLSGDGGYMLYATNKSSSNEFLLHLDHISDVSEPETGADSDNEGHGFIIGGQFITGKDCIIADPYYYARAEGYQTTAVQTGSHAEGKGTRIKQSYTVSSMGTPGYGVKTVTVDGNTAHGLIKGNIVQFEDIDGFYQVFEVSSTYSFKVTMPGLLDHSDIYLIKGVAFGDASHAEGEDTTASDDYAHAEGIDTIASETASHAEGYGTIASGDYSHAEGNQTSSTGDCAHAEGEDTTASGNGAHAEGYGTEATGNYSHTEGSICIPTSSGNGGRPGEIYTSGIAAHAEGYAAATQRAVENPNQLYPGISIAGGDGSHVEGYASISRYPYGLAPGPCTHAAWGLGAHAEGTNTIASGDYSHAEGQNTAAIGMASHAEGSNDDLSNSLRYFTIPGQNAGSSTFNPASLNISGTFNIGDIVVYYNSEDNSSTYRQITTYSPHELGLDSSFLSGPAEQNLVIYGVEHGVAYADYSHAEGMSSAIGAGSHAEGLYTTANGVWSHTEGSETSTSEYAPYSHAEGNGTTASGEGSHAEGHNTTASGSYSHAEGNGTTAFGDYSHAFGICTKTSLPSDDYVTDFEGAFACGTYNETGYMLMGTPSAWQTITSSTIDFSGLDSKRLVGVIIGARATTLPSGCEQSPVLFSVGVGWSDSNRKNIFCTTRNDSADQMNWFVAQAFIYWRELTPTEATSFRTAINNYFGVQLLGNISHAYVGVMPKDTLI